MKLTDNQKDILKTEVEITAVRSSGPGGQNVNKVSSKIELRYKPLNTQAFSGEQLALLNERLMPILTTDGYLIITAQESRSQVQNRELALNKFFALIEKSLTVKRKRIDTKPTFTSIVKRLDKKRQHSIKKALRKKNNWE